MRTKATVEGMLIHRAVFSPDRLEPVARVTLHLTDEKRSRDMLGAKAWLIIALRIHAATLEIARKTLRLREGTGDHSCD